MVPKVPNPSKVGDIRPISCCNVGRRITNNIFLIQESMRGYHKHSSSPKCAMKVDIMKAYDNVKWDFLWDVLTSMNFHPKMIQWLKACVSTANYSLCFNGEAIGYIPGQKGLRQGEVSSITHIKQSLTEFETLSGLSPLTFSSLDLMLWGLGSFDSWVSAVVVSGLRQWCGDIGSGGGEFPVAGGLLLAMAAGNLSPNKIQGINAVAAILDVNILDEVAPVSLNI
ncbi:hypothetical protein RHSIM_Rhsim01G0158500 [Rhododendron simsii]|uniref:Reverse transcriptase domain-containing protein n=1 Tax=Rhododendron simsii TaxID=118357 RepID=A0A834LVK0_RHOSS|nr:hypothetical protein RHSIM_Rhsim01G0158500 [Rhododendron simsii]